MTRLSSAFPRGKGTYAVAAVNSGKLMRRIGWLLVAISLLPAAAALGLRYAGNGELADIAIVCFAAMFFPGMFVVSIAGVVCLLKGEVKLRPWDAAKRAIWMFGIIMAVRFLAWVIFPSLGRDLTNAVMQSACFAIAYSLYATAYRRRPS